MREIESDFYQYFPLGARVYTPVDRHRFSRLINPDVVDWRAGRRRDNPWSIKQRAWLEMHCIRNIDSDIPRV